MSTDQPVVVPGIDTVAHEIVEPCG